MIRNMTPAMANCRRGSIRDQPQHLDRLKGLVREADVFSQGYRPGALASRGLSPEELAAVRPGLVYVSLCAFSHKGPWASRRGFHTVVHNVSGIITRQGELFPGAEPGPQFYPVSAVDYLTGYLMAVGAMVALARRAQEGGSWLVRISLAQTDRRLVDRGEVPEAALNDVAEEIPQADIDRWSVESGTPVGRLRHLGPTVQLSETRTRGAYLNPYFLGEYAVAVINTRSGGLARILPSASLSSRTLIQSGSAWNSFQFLSAASRLSCEMT